MSVEEKVVKRLNELIAQADRVRRTRQCDPESGLPDSVEHETFVAWIMSCRHFVRIVAGEDSEYHKRLDELGLGNWLSAVETARAVLISLSENYTEGWFTDLRQLAAAEVFDDFIEMAQHLCQLGYHVAAASLAGAVLEDSLRRLHLKKKVGALVGESSISKLNDSLHKAGVYAQPEWRQVQVWGDIRNEADHAHFEKVDATGVAQMISGIRDFIVKHLT